MAPMTPDQEVTLFQTLGEIRGELRGITAAVTGLQTSMETVKTAVTTGATQISDLQRRACTVEETVEILKSGEPPTRSKGQVWKDRGAAASVGVGLGAFLTELLVRIFSNGGPKTP